MHRTAVTPGRLYALMSTAFQQARAEGCRMCKMPLPYPVAPGGGDAPNWRVGTSIHSCPNCEVLIERIIETLSKAYDLSDFTRDLDARLERRSQPRPVAQRSFPRLGPAH
jgi:hypothetical protein